MMTFGKAALCLCAAACAAMFNVHCDEERSCMPCAYLAHPDLRSMNASEIWSVADEGCCVCLIIVLCNAAEE